MNVDFSSLDKSDFKCLKTKDGAIYYGQVVQILPPNIETDKLAGFVQRDESKKPRGLQTRGSDGQSNQQLNATHSSAGGFRVGSSGAGRPATVDPLEVLHQDGVEPLVVEDISQVDEELLPNLVTVRHGYGIQIQADKVSKYAGQWHYGARHGDGHLVNPDGSEYRGNLHFGKFNGYGQFMWPKILSETCTSEKLLGHSYLGNWKMGLMHGQGQFNHAEGQVLKPDFVNNLFNLNDGLFVNPFDTEAEMRATMERISQRKQKEAVEERKRNERISVRKVTDIQNYAKVLTETREAGRTPLIVSSLQNPIETMDLVISMGWDQSVVRNVWLRTAANHNNHALNWLRDIRSSYRQHYEQCLETQSPWVMNLLLDEDEDPSNPWEHHYDADYQFLFGKVGPGLPEVVWEGHKILKSLETLPEQLHRPLQEHFEQVLAKTQQESQEALMKIQQSPRSKQSQQSTNQQQFHQDQQASLNPSASELNLDQKVIMAQHLEEIRSDLARNINFSVFSKTKFDESLEEDAIIEQAKRRFGQSLPLHKIDIVLVTSLDEPAQIEETIQDQVAAEGGSVGLDTGSLGQKTNQ